MVKTSKKSKTKKQHKRLPKWASAIICIVVFIGFFMLFSAYMGLPNTLNTMMNTAYSLLIDTVFYIMAIAVLMGAISSILSEFGVIDLINKILSPLMKPIYGLPGAAAGKANAACPVHTCLRIPDHGIAKMSRLKPLAENRRHVG